METLVENKSQIQQFFARKTIFVTGGTGFLGRLLIEKLLRSCPDVGKIYMLVRAKRSKSPEERLREYFDEPIYDLIKEENSERLKKVIMMVGDCCLPDLGLDDNSKNVIISEVNCIFHCAATVRFNETLQRATAINVRATKDLLNLAKKVVNLQSFVHVSTAYAFCPLSTIEEKIYEPGMKAEDLLKLVDLVDEKRLENMQKILIDEWPNTYTFTKATAEDLVFREGKNLPTAIVRPSIVVATFEEPIQGWINNIYGVTGMLIGIELGVLRVGYDVHESAVEVVPADFVINSLMASAWSIGTKKQSQAEVPIFNFSTFNKNRIKWRELHDISEKYSANIPSTQQVWHKFFIRLNNPMAAAFLSFILQTIPAYVIDFLSYLVGKKTTYVELYNKINEHMKAVSYFAEREWNFKCDNVCSLFDKMSPKDKLLFNFDMRTFDWDVFFHRYAYGGRKYLLKESIDTVEEGIRRRFYLKIAHYALVGVLGLIFIGILYLFVALFNSSIFKLCYNVEFC